MSAWPSASSPCLAVSLAARSGCRYNGGVNVLDTHRLVKRLVAVGFSDEQAETVTDVVREGREADFSNLATKSDLAAAVTQLRTEMGAMESRMNASMSEQKADILKWVIGLLLVQGSAVVTLIRLLPGH